MRRKARRRALINNNIDNLINDNVDNLINDNIDNLRPNQHPLGAQGEYSSPRQEVDCRGMLSKLSSKNKLILIVGYNCLHCWKS